MAFRAPKAEARFEQEIRKSRFIGIAIPLPKLEEAEREIERIRAEFPDATHVCWAAVAGDPDAGGRFVFDDAGEPAGTAGKPILSVLHHRGVGDALVAVVRYFGGVKLGAGGLVRAYSGTASRTLDRVELETVTPRFEVRVVVPFGDEAAARRVLERLGVTIRAVEYGDAVDLRVRVSEDEKETLERELRERTSARARVIAGPG